MLLLPCVFCRFIYSVIFFLHFHGFVALLSIRVFGGIWGEGVILKKLLLEFMKQCICVCDIEIRGSLLSFSLMDLGDPFSGFLFVKANFNYNPTGLITMEVECDLRKTLLVILRIWISYGEYLTKPIINPRICLTAMSVQIRG